MPCRSDLVAFAIAWAFDELVRGFDVGDSHRALVPLDHLLGADGEVAEEDDDEPEVYQRCESDKGKSKP